MIIDEDNNNVFIIEKLNNLKTSLNQDKLDLQKIRKDIKQLNEFKGYQNYDYLNDLLDPIKRKGVKIPSDKPLPTCSFQLHNYATFRPSDDGNDLFLLNPYFLASESYLGKEVKASDGTTFYLATTPSAYWFYRYPDLDGMHPTEGNMNGFADNKLQTIADVYSSYRLVSAAVEVRYTGPLEEASGVLGCGITFISDFPFHQRIQVKNGPFNPSGPVIVSIAPSLQQYGNFELIRDSPYFKEVNVLEGIRALYFPIDNSYNEFRKVYDGSNCSIRLVPGAGGNLGYVMNTNDEKRGFAWCFYIMNAPTTNGRNFRIDLYANFECLPKPELLNYIPVSLNVYPLSKQLISQFIEEVKDKAIQKLNN